MLAPARPVHGSEYEPIFVRLVPGTDVVATRRTLQSKVQDRDSALLMDASEAQMLAARINQPAEITSLPDEYMLYRRVGTPDSDDTSLFEVLDTGLPVQMPHAGPLPTTSPDPIPPSPIAGTPIVAIIDDGIGFLNARFRRTTADGTHQSRFHALWLQAMEQHAHTPQGAVAGRVLDRAAIDAMIATGDETGHYAATNKTVFAPETRAETAYATTHGTHVLDLAAGADPADVHDPVRDWPLLGVQLPPESIDDTSGTRFESYLVMGVRWILRQARAMDATAPVIINLSLGVLAGPKNGTRFAEFQIAREARIWEEVTGQPVRIVWAFGNSYRSSQVARFAFARKTATPKRITWRVQPDDETSSFVEIHTRGKTSEVVQIGLKSPGGAVAKPITLAPGEIRTLERSDGAALARIYHVPGRRMDGQTLCPAHYVLALVPTRGQKMAEPEASAGAWQISVRGNAKVEVLIQVQRDDAIRGSDAHGRQSYLDDPKAHEWDGDRAAYVAPAARGPITDAGCHNALTTAQARQVFSVGAAQTRGRTAGVAAENFGPAAYTGQGAAWSTPSPTAATVVGVGTFYNSIRAAGTLSGSTRRMNGTSAAAGRLTRALALSAARIIENLAKPDSSQTDDLDPAAVGVVTTGHPDARLGAAIVTVPEALPSC
jgi:hypothetical protein